MQTYVAIIHKMKKILTLTLLTSITLACAAQKEGIDGKIFVLSGNQMPGPGRVAERQTAVKEVFIYKVVTVKDTERTNVFFSVINANLIAKTICKEDGSFKIVLPPGAYSVFVKEPGGLFANSFDKDGRINPVVVTAKKFTPFTMNVDYNAVY